MTSCFHIHDIMMSTGAAGYLNRTPEIHDTRVPVLARFVHVSSLDAQGPSPDGTPHGPGSTPAPVTHYGKSKLEAEAIVLRRAPELPVTIVRPPAVYGPGDTRMLTVFRAIAGGV